MAWTQLPSTPTSFCNGEVLRYFRERISYSEKELADAAECSQALVAEADSGQPISIDTIDHLAAALSTTAEPVYPEDLISDPLALTKEYLTALYCRHQNFFQAIRHFLDDEVVFWVAGDPDNIPFAGKHQGLAEVERLFEMFFSLLEAPEDHDHEPCYSLVAKGNVVIALGDTWIHPIGVPLKEPLKVANRFTYRRGKLILFEDAFDTESGAEILHEHARQEQGIDTNRNR